MQKAPMVDQFKFLINTSLVARKIVQYIENKIKKFNKKVEQLKAEAVSKDKIIIGLKN